MNTKLKKTSKKTQPHNGPQVSDVIKEYQKATRTFDIPDYSPQQSYLNNNKPQIAFLIKKILDLNVEVDAFKAALAYQLPLDSKEYVDKVAKSKNQAIQHFSQLLIWATSKKKVSKTTTQLLHYLLGVHSEAAEMMMAYSNLLAQNKLDSINFEEEYGDLNWYLARISDVFNIDHQDTLEKNLKKLKTRYAKKQFSYKEAINRNTKKERSSLV